MEQLKLEQIIEDAKLILPIEQTELEQMIEQAGYVERLNVDNRLTNLPKGTKYLTVISIAIVNKQLTSLPESIGKLSNLTTLFLCDNRLTSLPESIGKIFSLTILALSNNQLTNLPESIGELSNLTKLYLDGNQLTSLPNSIVNLANLTELNLTDNLIVDLSILKKLSKLKIVRFMGVNLSCKYWTKISEWKAAWLLDEDNAEVRRALIQHFGYKKICEELNTINLDVWKEYTLLKINNIEEVYEDSFDGFSIGFIEPLVLLKMTCPSTGHIHLLRVPPEMTSAEAAITWVNHGIHPDEFAVQT